MAPCRIVKIAVTLDREMVVRLDELVAENRFPSRSRAIQEAIRDKLQRLQRNRLARECAKLDPAFEQAMAEESLTEDVRHGPEM
jgi:Arc/MetJ-type ribon-helix-helix transcriptional regulator